MLVELPTIYLFTLCLYAVAVQEYEATDFNRPFEYYCDGDFKVLSSIQSRHSSDGDDRQYRFMCRDVNTNGEFNSYFWTDYVEDYTEPFIYTCPKNEVITGVDSQYSDTHGDRIFKFRCSWKENYYTRSCRSTGYLNELEESFSSEPAEDRVFIGFHSYYDDATK